MNPAPALPSADEARPSSAATSGAVDGESQLTALWTLYVLTLRQHLHGKRWMVMALLFILPAGLAVLVRATALNAHPIELEFILAFMFIPQALLPLVALIYASGIIRDEQEEQTITYLLVRPIPKWAIYVVKLLATVTTTVLLTVIFTALTYAVIYIGADAPASQGASRFAKAAAIHGIAIAAYCSLFGLMSLLTKRVLLAGIVYIAVVEGLLANLPFGIRLLTIIYYTRLLAHRTLTFVGSTPDGRVEDFSGEAWQLDARADPILIGHPSNSMALAILLAASLVCAFLAAWLCTRREFHVKTPEGD